MRKRRERVGERAAARVVVAKNVQVSSVSRFLNNRKNSRQCAVQCGAREFKSAREAHRYERNETDYPHRSEPHFLRALH